MPRKSEIHSVIHAKNTEISVITTTEKEDYISITDIAKYRDAANPRFIIQNWMRNRNTIDFLGLWEELNNPDFNRVEFEAVRQEAGYNSFVLTPQKWISSTNAIGLRSKAGRYGGGTFAHKDIAFEFASWISPEFKLYVIQDYQKLKEDESYRLAYDWSVKRILSKANYRIHTDAVQKNLIPPELPNSETGYIYAEEADILNLALFGMTARQWRDANPDAKGNIRDYATIQQLLILANLENLNASFIEQGLSKADRLHRLNAAAIQQMKSLEGTAAVRKLQELNDTPML